MKGLRGNITDTDQAAAMLAQQSRRVVGSIAEFVRGRLDPYPRRIAGTRDIANDDGHQCA